MKKMPAPLKQKIRQYAKANEKARRLHEEIVQILHEYDVPYDNLVSTNQDGDEPYTEALAFINNAEGDIEEDIHEIEKVFVYFAKIRDDQTGEGYDE